MMARSCAQPSRCEFIPNLFGCGHIGSPVLARWAEVPRSKSSKWMTEDRSCKQNAGTMERFGYIFQAGKDRFLSEPRRIIYMEVQDYTWRCLRYLYHLCYIIQAQHESILLMLEGLMIYDAYFILRIIFCLDNLSKTVWVWDFTPRLIILWFQMQYGYAWIFIWAPPNGFDNCRPEN